MCLDFDTGWNIYQRTMMAGLQLDPSAWKQKLKEVSCCWREMDAHQRDPYVAQAIAEQALRETAAHEPLPAKQPPSSAAKHDGAAGLLCRNAQKSVSRQRSMVTYKQFKASDEWQEHDGICCADGAINLDLIDIVTKDDDIQGQWDQYARPADKLPALVDMPIHHSVCHAEFGGLCKASPWLRVATQFVWSMNDVISSGTFAPHLLIVRSTVSSVFCYVFLCFS